jgi:hypothetical protein
MVGLLFSWFALDFLAVFFTGVGDWGFKFLLTFPSFFFLASVAIFSFSSWALTGVSVRMAVLRFRPVLLPFLGPALG